MVAEQLDNKKFLKQENDLCWSKNETGRKKRLIIPEVKFDKHVKFFLEFLNDESYKKWNLIQQK